MSCSGYGCRGSTGGGGRTGAEDLAEVGRFAEVDSGGYVQEIKWWGLRSGCGNLHRGYV